MKTDTSEKGLESLIVSAMTGLETEIDPAEHTANDGKEPYGGLGWISGDPANYNREYAVDLNELLSFLEGTQPAVAAGFRP